MTDTTDLLTEPNGADTPDGAQEGSAASPSPARARRRTTSGGLSAKVLPELQALAVELGITGTGRMRKSQLIEAITVAQGEPAAAAGGTAAAEDGKTGAAESAAQRETGETAAAAQGSGHAPASSAPARTRRRASAAAGHAQPPAAPVKQPDEDQRPEATAAPADVERSGGSGTSTGQFGDDRQGADRQQGDWQQGDRQQDDSQATDEHTRDGDDEDGSGRNERVDRGRERFLEREARRQERAAAAASDEDGQQNGRSDVRDRDGRATGRDSGRGKDRDSSNRDSNGEPGNRGNGDRDTGNRDTSNRDGRQGMDEGSAAEEEEGARRGRFRERGRGRNRSRNNERYGSNDLDPVLAEDDVLVPIGGILDVGESNAFVRTSGYLAGPNDVYVTLNQVRRYGLRRGDAVTGQVRQQREGERKDRFNALVRLDSVNGLEVEEARDRPEFGKLTPLYPQDRLRLETDPKALTTRVIDLVMPVGKGQRALIVSPPKAGKTMVLQAIANAISVNNPEVHLMVVLVDERPEEVTDMQRSVKGEVIASTFDRPPTDHITVAELSIERAKRLVELGHDVVVLLDSITQLGRAYNLGAPASGRILTGGVDSAALYPPKRFLGAARNLEDGGSLTILATALVETGSAMDAVMFEEFQGTGNAELKLDRGFAEQRIFPAIDVAASGTRREELLLSPDELAIVLQLRKVLDARDSGSSLELLLDTLSPTRTNIEFLMQIQRTTVGAEAMAR